MDFHGNYRTKRFRFDLRTPEPSYADKIGLTGHQWNTTWWNEVWHRSSLLVNILDIYRICHVLSIFLCGFGALKATCEWFLEDSKLIRKARIDHPNYPTSSQKSFTWLDVWNWFWEAPSPQKSPKQKTHEHWNNPSLFRVYMGLYYAVMWGL